jgi:hypothetical protein
MEKRYQVFVSSTYSLNDQLFQTIKIQLQALGLVRIQWLRTTNNSMALFWSLTKAGKNLMVALRTVKALPKSGE